MNAGATCTKGGRRKRAVFNTRRHNYLAKLAPSFAEQNAARIAQRRQERQAETTIELEDQARFRALIIEGERFAGEVADVVNLDDWRAAIAEADAANGWEAGAL